jgi:hypothetical protein
MVTTYELTDFASGTAIIRSKTKPRKSLLGKTIRHKSKPYVITELGRWLKITHPEFKKFPWAAPAKLQKKID